MAFSQNQCCFISLVNIIPVRACARLYVSGRTCVLFFNSQYAYGNHAVSAPIGRLHFWPDREDTSYSLREEIGDKEKPLDYSRGVSYTSGNHVVFKQYILNCLIRKFLHEYHVIYPIYHIPPSSPEREPLSQPTSNHRTSLNHLYIYGAFNKSACCLLITQGR